MGEYMSEAMQYLEWEAEEYAEENFYKHEMLEYAEIAIEKLGEYAEVIAEAYLAGCQKACDLFELKGLKEVHALAIEEDLASFIIEYDRTEKREHDWDD